MTLQIIKSSDLKRSIDNLKFLLVGQTGSGKSTFASGFPTPGLVFDFDKGALSYKDGDWDCLQYDTSNGAEWIRLINNFKEVKEKVLKGEYKTVVVDTTTTLASLAMSNARLINGQVNEFGHPVWNVHYSAVPTYISDFIRMVVDLPCNVIVLTHVTLATDEMTQGTLAAPALPGKKLPVELPALFSEVWYTRPINKDGGREYRIQVQSDGLYPARSRLAGKEGVLPPFVEAEYSVIKGLIEKGK